METLSKEKTIKQAKKVEDYQGDESDIVGAEKSGKYHGFIAGTEWATAQLKADKEEMLEMLELIADGTAVCNTTGKIWSHWLTEIESLIQKMKQ